MYVSRLVYIVCLLEAVLWVQPNFALSNQRDMAKLLQTQTVKLNELAQNAAKDNSFAGFQKHLEMIAKEQQMVARANIQIHNTQTALVDKVTEKQGTVNQGQRISQFIVGRDGKGERGGVAGDGEKGVENGAVPVFASSQAYLVACCLLVAGASAFMNESSPVPESSESSSAETDSAAAAEAEEESAVARMKRPRDLEDSEEAELAAVSVEEGKESRRGRKRARLGVRVTSSVQQYNQAKKNNCHSKRRCSGNARSRETEVVTSQAVVSDETILCSPSVSLSSDASSPRDSHVSSPSPAHVASGMFSTLPPELACEFEAEHALYFHGIACPSSSSPALNLLSPNPSVGMSSYAPVSTPLFEHLVVQPTQRVVAIDPALLLVEPRSPELFQQDDGFTPSVSSGQGSEIDESEETKATVPAPLFDVSLEPLLQDQCFC